jgi:hypothetical protein
MPVATSKRKASELGGGRGSKRQNGTGSSSSPRQTPLRQCSRINKGLGGQVGRPLRRVRTESSKEDDSIEDGNSSSDSDFKSAKSEQEEDNPETDDDNDDEPQSYSIPLPKAREAGDTPYEDNRLHPNTFLFLKDLKANNNREWLKCLYISDL